MSQRCLRQLLSGVALLLCCGISFAQANIRVLFAYTPAALASFGGSASNFADAVQLRTTSAQAALDAASSGINLTAAAVVQADANYTVAQVDSTRVSRYLQVAHDQANADIVVTVTVADTQDICGATRVPGPDSAGHFGDPAWAFITINADCFKGTTLTLQHEIGHVLGFRHFSDQVQVPWFAGHGRALAGPSPSNNDCISFRTIMGDYLTPSAGCQNTQGFIVAYTQQVNRYSTPNAYIWGVRHVYQYPLGTSGFSFEEQYLPAAGGIVANFKKTKLSRVMIMQLVNFILLQP